MRVDDCIFCKIARGDIPSATIYEDGDFRVILDLGPASKGHALILPKEHYKDLCEADSAVTAKKESLNASGFNVVQNNGESAGQTVFHLHVHVIPRYERGPAMVQWIPGTVDAEELERTAEIVRKGL